jgi:hypothetical protein
MIPIVSIDLEQFFGIFFKYFYICPQKGLKNSKTGDKMGK